MQDADHRRLVEDSPLATLVVRGGVVQWANAAAHEMTGTAEVLRGRSFASLLHPDDRTGAASTLLDPPAGGAARGVHEWRVLRADGATVAVEVLLSAVRVDGVPAVAVSCWDVSRHVARQRDLAHRATHDRLTGLPNRSLFEDRWALARSRGRRSGDVALVAFCDVDDLKPLNDRHGHVVGDLALVEVGERLRGAARAEDTVARFGGDEFAVLVESSAGVDREELLRRLRAATAAVPVEATGPDGAVVRLSVRCSVGLVVDDPGASTVEVLGRADAVMYAEKRRAQG